MEVGKLTVQRRNKTGKGMARRLRSQGLVPAICYGAKLDAPISLSLDTKALKAALDPEKKRNTVIDLTIEGEKSTLAVMLKDYQIHAIKQVVTHVDLIAIDPDVEVDSDVPVSIEGKAKGAEAGGQIHIVRRSVLVRSTPAQIPAKLVLNIDELDIGDALHISDLTFPDGVVAIDSSSLAILTMTAPEKEKEVAEEADADAAPAADAEEKK